MRLQESTPGRRPLGVAMIGYAFMGKAHSNAWRNVASFFHVPAFEQRVLVGRDPEGVADAAQRYGWAESATDWRAVVARDDIHVVDICAPGFLHAEIALAALAAGKHVLVEKPLANTLAEAEAMAAAAREAQSRGVQSMVGFNYRRVPALALARELISEGRRGRRPASPGGLSAGLAGRPGNAHDVAAAQGHRRFRRAGRHRLTRHRPGAVPARGPGDRRFRPAADLHLAPAGRPTGWKK